MNEKKNIQELVDNLSESHGLSKRNADSFVKEFFGLIEEALERDKYVRIKGLGTFKLINVDSRESINVNTGERFEIQEHTKISFTPEPALKETINKPFSHFETVVLNEGTVLTDTPVEEENGMDEELSVEPAPVSAPEAPVVMEAPVVIETPAIEAPVIQPHAQEPLTVVETPTVDSTIEESEPIAPEPQREEPTSPSEPQVEPPLTREPIVREPVFDEEEKIPPVPPLQPRRRLDTEEYHDGEPSTMKYFIGIVSMIVILCVAALAFIYFPSLYDLFKPKKSAPVEEPVAPVLVQDTVRQEVHTDTIADSPVDSLNVVVADSIVEEPVKEVPKQVVDTEPKKVESVPVKPVAKPAEAPVIPDSSSYTIVGTETTYTIKSGETLTRVALRFWGTKKLWPYLVKHNPKIITDPNHVPYGTTIRIPKLEKSKK